MEARVLVRYGVAMLSVAAAMLHLSAAQDHSGDDVVVALFVAAAWMQAVWSWLVATRADRWVLLVGIALNVGLIAVWGLSRTVGLDIGTHADGSAEAVGFKDAVSVGFELVALVGVVALLGSRLDSIRVGSRRAATQLFGLLAATVFALSVPAFLASSHDDGGRHGKHRSGQDDEPLSEEEKARELERIERLEGLRE